MVYPPYEKSFFSAHSDYAHYNKEYLAPQIWQQLSPLSRANYMIFSALLWLILFAYTSFVRREAPTKCKRCGRPVCRRCHPRMIHQELCYDCYQEEAYRQNGLKNPEVKPKKWFTVSYFKRQKLMRHFLKILAFVFPPATLFFTGRKRSLIYLLLYTLAIINLALGFNFIDLPFMIAAGGLFFLKVSGILILLITLIVGIRGSYLEAEK